MSKPILLWWRRPELTSDDACTHIIKYTLPTPPAPAPYETAPLQDMSQLRYVPSLAYFCIQKLLPYPDQMHVIGSTRLDYRPSDSPGAFDLLRALIPSYGGANSMPLDLSQVDPRLWALLVQLYRGLPETFRTYTLPLSDRHLPLLQQIPQTPDFALITVVELPGCHELNDESIVELRALHSLSALDASTTMLTAWGLRNFSKTLAFTENEEQESASPARARTGPWGLRILRLRNCFYMKNEGLLETLAKFPLLSAVDLRGCPVYLRDTGPFCPAEHARLYHPVPLTESLYQLSHLSPSDLFSHQNPYVIYINDLHHHQDPVRTAARANARAMASASVWNSCTGRPSVPSLSLGRPLQDGGNGCSSCEEALFYGYNSECCHNGEEDEDFENEDEGEVYGQVAGYDRGDDRYQEPPYRNEDENVLAVAAGEASASSRHLAAQRFYCTHPTPSGRSTHTSTTPVAHAPIFIPDPLMLYRAPPPWSHLDRSSLENERRKYKRRRTEASVLDTEVQKVDRARLSMRAVDSVKAMVGMVQRRATQGANLSQSQASLSGPVSVNPFLRKRHEVTQEAQCREEVPCKVETSPARRLDVTSRQQPNAESSKSRSLKPLTSLKVPKPPVSQNSKAKQVLGVKKNTTVVAKKPLPSKQAGLPALMNKLSENGKMQSQDRLDSGLRMQGHAMSSQMKAASSVNTSARTAKLFNWKGWSGS
ncbi:hypothetical protein OBBRIDRAFT_745256 [Obba rivulosa]|uniref:Uncharacterized protein n=1 Tax=Obba rivulosa TaxID=1052685 RepID=A0A8E2J612_9APHY|nr:hypothetical protein OBBRIDRAFT_745256 [Obba rivulosa]